MNIVFLSPHFPPHYLEFCRQLKQAGANVLGIADVPFENLADDLRAALTEYYRVADLNDYDALVRACGFFTHKYGRIDRFESLNEYWLGLEARIRDDFNIVGVRGSGIDFIRRKSRMKDRFRKAGVPVARGKVVANPDEAGELIAATGYPVVAKPDAGVGALDTFRLDNDDDLTHFFQNKPPVDYIMEEFIAGRIYSFDGLADRNRNLVFHTAHTFSQGIMETVNQGMHISYHSLREIPPALDDLGHRCVEAFEVRERFFHIEFFQTDAETYVGLEVNMRPPGGFTTDMFNYACDIDIYRTWAQLVVNGRTDLEYARKYHCCYASRKNSLDYVHDHEAVMSRYGRFMVQVAVVPGIFSSALGDIGYIFRSPDEGRIEAISQFIHATLKP
ncbi:MAG: ATP-grasp domain-containing protein [Desulfosarcina sp.]|nr:ATP-grasp domain-containing protein [Desulfobacterales bacterium]